MSWLAGWQLPPLLQQCSLCAAVPRTHRRPARRPHPPLRRSLMGSSELSSPVPSNSSLKSSRSKSFKSLFKK